MNPHLELNLTLCGESARRFLYIKRVLGLESNASVIKHILIKEHKRIMNLNAKKRE
jgi:hypothetical protein